MANNCDKNSNYSIKFIASKINEKKFNLKKIYFEIINLIKIVLEEKRK